MTMGSNVNMTGALQVGPFVRHRVLKGLREALALARADLAGELEPVYDAVRGVLERLDALRLTQTRDAAPAPPRSELPFTALAASRGEPVREFLLIPFGEIAVERPLVGGSFVFTRAHAESAARWFEQLGRKLAIDYEHQSFERCNPRGDGLKPAAGWIGGLAVRDDGLWAVEVTWTERASALLGSGEYKYFSPVIFWTDEDHTDVAALGPVALTNDPAMRGVQPLAARRDLDGGDDDPPDTLCAAEELRTALTLAQTEADELRAKLAAQEADTFVERGLRLGKIVDSTSLDWRADYLRDPEEAAARLARAPLLLPPGRVLPVDPRGQVVRLRRAVAPGAPIPAGVEAEDLAAYEQAVAAGRVQSTGQ